MSEHWIELHNLAARGLLVEGTSGKTQIHVVVPLEDHGVIARMRAEFLARKEREKAATELLIESAEGEQL